MPRVHYKGRQGDYYVMVSKEECVKCLTLQLVSFLCCRLQCTEFYLSVGIVFLNPTGYGYAWTKSLGCLELIWASVSI